MKWFDHKYLKPCRDLCNSKYKTPILNIALSCEHVKKSLVYHLAQAYETVKFYILVTTILPSCKHTVKVYYCKLFLLFNYLCKAIYGTSLTYSHNDKQTCHKCNSQSEYYYISRNNYDVCKSEYG